jgi:hypothetical protein
MYMYIYINIAFVAAAGQISALNELGLLEHIKYIGGISGGNYICIYMDPDIYMYEYIYVCKYDFFVCVHVSIYISMYGQIYIDEHIRVYI